MSCAPLNIGAFAAAPLIAVAQPYPINKINDVSNLGKVKPQLIVNPGSK
jgi:hypothetical protein